MDLSELKYKISKLVFFIGSFKYRRNKNLYVSFFLIAVLISSAAFGIYLYQKNVITKKENILKSYFAELTGKNPGDNAGSNNDANSGNNSGTASGNTSAGNTAGKTGANSIRPLTIPVQMLIKVPPAVLIKMAMGIISPERILPPAPMPAAAAKQQPVIQLLK